MSQKFPLPPWLAIVLVLIGGLAVSVTFGNDDSGQPAATITVQLDGPGKQTVEIPRGAAAPAIATEVGDHDASRDETPPGADPADLDAAARQQDRLAATDQLPIVTPDAAPSVAGCRSRFVGNYSTRHGVKPRLLVAHLTVSPNRPGWGDVNAITGLFDQPRFAASSNYVNDNEGHCNYIVRESDKAWTQATFNPVAISVEQINTGSERTYAKTRGLRRLGQIFAGAARRWHIPIQRGSTRGCIVTRPGIVDHKSLGPCGGGHVDIGKFSVASVVRATRQAAARHRCKSRSSRASRKRCLRAAYAS